MFCSKCGKETIENAVFCASCGASLTGGQAPRKKTNLSLAAGILDIVCGGLVLFFAIIITIVFIVTAGDEEGPPGFFGLFPMAMAVVGALSLVGGICALRRRNWPMALTGAIAAVLPSSLIGVAALVLTVMAKDEFE